MQTIVSIFTIRATDETNGDSWMVPGAEYRSDRFYHDDLQGRAAANAAVTRLEALGDGCTFKIQEMRRY